MSTIRFLIAVVVLVCIGCGPVKPVGPPANATRTLAIHTCVPAATVWLDGADVPALRDVTDADGTVTFPAFPATIAAFNLHATAAAMPQYGVVITMTKSTEPLVVILGSCAR